MMELTTISILHDWILEMVREGRGVGGIPQYVP